MATRQYIGARYVPKFAEPSEWSSALQYEPLTIVTYQGNSFTSKKPVPAGVDITNTEYWVSTGIYNTQVELYREEVEEVKESTSYTRDFDNWVKNKTVKVFGDSISDPDVTSNAWPTQLHDLIGCNVVNNSVSGRTMVMLAGLIAGEQVSQDCNVVMIGANDGYNVDENMGVWGTSDATTFIGACEKVFSSIQERASGALNVYACDTRTAFDGTGYYKNLRLFYYVAQKIAKKYGFIFWDLYNDLPDYNPAITSLRTLYAPDGMHPNEAGQRMLADVICRLLVNKTNDNFPAECFVVSDTITGDLTPASAVYSLATYDTTDTFTVSVGGAGLDASNVVNYKINICHFPAFFRPSFGEPYNIQTNIENKDSLGVACASYQQTNLSVDYYHAEPSTSFRLVAKASWKCL